MKQVTLICDLCQKEIDKETKFHTLNVPILADTIRKEWHEAEYHFCEEHNGLDLSMSLMSWKIDMFNKLLELFKANKWEPSEE